MENARLTGQKFRLTVFALAKIIIFTFTIAVFVAAPVTLVRLADVADWTPGYWLGMLSGLVMAFALWWAYLILCGD